MYIFFAIVAFVFLGLDFKKPAQSKLVFASSFMFLAITAYKFPHDYLIQATSFFAFLGIFYLLIKQVFKNGKIEKEKLKSFDINKNKFAKVTKDIGKTLSIDGIGKVEINNEFWSAKSIDDGEIKTGSTVEIVSRENLILNVKKV